jgi:demethylmenaquinone methyltransferase/2-methoxy-6-polyprenyl-1,4-benzoquinol methylase
VRDRFRASLDARGRGNPVPTEDIGALFDRIADRYDAMNLVISAFQEPRWRRRLVEATGLEPGMAAIDVASGTGKVAASLADRVGTFGRILGVDVSDRMVARARAEHADRIEIEFVIGNALDLPVDDRTFDAATIAFGMRNLPDYRRGFEELRRAVRPGGRVVCLEIARPLSLIGRLGQVWFERIVPRLGSLIGEGRAYAYLVESVRGYPAPEEIADVMRAAGLVDVTWTPMTFGMVTLHAGRRPAPEGAGDAVESRGRGER